MFKRFTVAFLFVACSVTSVTASPLHNDSKYHGAFTLLAAADITGATAKYTTQIVISNLSDHTVSIRLELYSTNGYREGILVNTLPPSVGSEVYGFWGGNQANWEYTNVLGTNAMGAVRVVAVTAGGDEDPTAVLHGYGRLWIEPTSGGRISEYVPGLSDYEATGGLRRDLSHNDYVPYIVNVMPFARNLTDRTYGGSRINVGFVNFDRDHEATFTIGQRDSTSFWGSTSHADAIAVTVPPGSVRQVALPLLSYEGGHPDPRFPNDTPLQNQVFSAGKSSGGGQWATFASIVDGTTSASTLLLDPWTSTRQ